MQPVETMWYCLYVYLFKADRIRQPIRELSLENIDSPTLNGH